MYKDFCYLTILFGTRLANIVIYPLGCSNKVLTVSIYGTNHGKQFVFYMNASVTYNSKAVGIVSLPEDTRARSFRIFFEDLKDEDDELLLTIDFMGFMNETDVIIWDPCSNNQQPLPSPIEPITVLQTSDYFIFCGTYYNLGGRFMPRKRCYRLKNTERTLMYDFGPFVSRIIAYFPRLNILFGIFMDGQSLIMSRNYGIKWASTQISFYRKVTNDEHNIIDAMPIPWIAKRDVFDHSTKGEKCMVSDAGRWQVCFDGVYKEDRRVLKLE